MHYDCIIIGSGAGGSAAAYRLALAGKQVLMVEKGQVLPADGSTLDVAKVIGKGLFKSREIWLDGHNRSFVPEEYFNVGGKTKWYGAALLRFAPKEFEPESEHHCLGWPISYSDLEPYYDEAEQLLAVRYFDIEPDLQAIRERIARRSSNWTHQLLPLAIDGDILTDAHEARHFDGFASVKGYKADAQNALLAKIVGRPNFTLMTGCGVSRLIGSGRLIVGVELADGRRMTADRIVLAAGAMHSPGLLQAYLDAENLHRQLAHRQVIGGHYKRHLLTALVALSPSVKTDNLRKTTLWLNATFPHSSVQPLGFGADVLASLLPRFVPRFVKRSIGRRAYGFFLQTEDGSNSLNRVTTETDKNGRVCPKLDYRPERAPTLVSEHRAMIRSFRQALLRAGLIAFTKAIPLAGTAHACGTLVTGNDPERSVVDRFGKAHHFNNLYVADGSILPRSSRVNPALTIFAWGLRTADHILGGES